MRRGPTSRERCLGTSYRDAVSRRRSATPSNQLPSCQLRLCLGMPTLDKPTLHAWLHHWQDEFDAAYLYLVLAGQASEPWHKTGSGGFLRNVVYGFNDGLTANFGLVAGVIGANVAPHIVPVSGLAGMIADALSMGASGYLAAKSEQEVYAHEIAMEKEEIRLMPEVEEEELALVYQTKGVEAGIARQMAAEVMRDSQRALEEQVREELKIGEAHATPFKEGWLTGAATAVGALIPVAPFLALSGRTAAWTAFTVAMLSHFVVGGARSFFTWRGVIRSGIDMFVVGLGVAAVGYLVGDLVAKIF